MKVFSLSLIFHLLILTVFLPSQVSFGQSNISLVLNNEMTTQSNYNHTLEKHIEFTSLDTIWPLDRSTWINELNLTSTFGPRQKASEDFRFDFHRGLDMPASYGTPVYAIADGIIRMANINETHQQRDDGSIEQIYTSTVIQIKHNNSQENQLSNIDYYYSNYLHINGTQVQVSPGEEVTQGQLLGYVGDDPNSNFPHLHFEIREDGLNQRHTTHPLEYLRSSNSDFPQIHRNMGLTNYFEDQQIKFMINISNQELDFSGFSISGHINDLEINVDYDMIELNHQTENALDLDNEVVRVNSSEITVYPHRYSNYIDDALYNVSIKFLSFDEVEVNEYDLQVDVYDIFNSGTTLNLTNENYSQTNSESNTKTDTSFLTIHLSFMLFVLIIPFRRKY